jgi:hypothetical protein
VSRPRWAVVVSAAGVVLFASSFVPLWATYRVPGLGLVAPYTSHQNAWAAYGLTMQLALALALASVVVAVMLRARPESVSLLVALSAAVALLLVWQIVRGPQGSSDPGGYGIERGLLLFTGGALGAVMAYGSYRAWAETGPPGDRRG